MKHAILLIGLFLMGFVMNAQELDCRVQVLSPAVQLSDKRMFTTLETQIREFMNNQRWTNDNFKRDERIQVNLTFNITNFNLPDEYRCNLIVQVSRPVYNTNYPTLLLNHQDNDIDFRYIEFQPIEFSSNAYINNLSSLLGFYAYVAIGLDYDSFSPEGGTPYFNVAQQIIQNVQPTNIKGWMPNEMPPRNRYWLVENYMNPVFKPLREAMYKYHRQGLDLMYDRMEQGRAAILESLQGLKKVQDQRPGSFNLQVFFNTKADELVNIFKQASPQDKQKALELLNNIDAPNGNKYSKIMQ